MSVSHLLYGLRISANLPIPGVPLSQSIDMPDVYVHLRSGSPPLLAPKLGSVVYKTEPREPNGAPGLLFGSAADGSDFVFLYGDGVCFLVEPRGRGVRVGFPEGYSIEDAATYLVGPVLGFVLRLRGIVPLHASAVCLGDQVIAFLGGPGAGKSTTAAAFAQRGCPVLSDDVMALQVAGDEFVASAGYPRVNLWPDSVRALFGSEGALPHITPTWEKRYLPLGQNRFAFESKPLPLAAIYFLDERDRGLLSPAIEGLPPSAALLTLVANTYVNYLLDSEMRSREFDALCGLVNQVPVRRTRPTGCPEKISHLCDAILSDFQELTRVSQPCALEQVERV